MSTWYPIGPDFVYATRDSAVPMRLSRRNEWARQAKITALAVDPTATPPALYTVEQPYPQATDDFPQYYPQNPYWPIGGSAFCSQDDGWTWTPIADTLIQTSPGLVPTCIAVHPVQPNYIYLGTASGEIYVSSNRGADWGSPQSLGAAQIIQIVVDPRTTSNPSTTTLYAATTAGLQLSTDGGASWQTTLLVGWVMSLAFNMPAAGTADLYAGVQGVGLYHATDATGAWTLLSGSGSGLPAQAGQNFNGVLVDFCRQNPNQVYVVLGPNGGNISLYASASGPIGFAIVTSSTAPISDLYRFAFAVAPNSPGDGANDILFFSGVQLYRSNNAGGSWDACVDDLHHDHNCFGFSTLAPAPGQVPTVYVGCDGGLFASTSLADGSVGVTVYPTDFNDGLVYNSASGVSQNYNHAKLSVAVRAYAADPASGAYGYTGAQDTGLAGHLGTLGWRGLDNISDVWGVAALGGDGGLTVWYTTPFDLRMISDQGEAAPGINEVYAFPEGVQLSGCSTMRVNATGLCLTGAFVLTTLQDPIPTTGVQSATPASMLGIVPGALVMVNNAEIVTVTSVTATTFSADFSNTYAANTPIKVFSGIVFAIDPTARATQVSQVFGSDSPKTLAAHPTDATFAALITGTQASPSNQRVWMTSGAPLGPTTIWNEIAGSTKPTGGLISAVAVDSAGHVYVLLTDLTWTAPGGGAVTTPLYEVSSGSWIPQPSSGLPAGQFGSLVIDPNATDILYASSGGQVYQLALTGGTWTWTAVGSGLPGQNIVDLWIGNVGAVGTPKVLLRAAVVARGVWEADVTGGANTPDPPTRPYMRHQPLDQGWLVPSLEGQVDPFSPSSGPSLYHWESPDIKVDAQQPDSPNFYQNDPEDPLPLSHVAFDQLIDNSQALPESDSANVHVQVHNRSYTTLNKVAVWAIWTNCSAGVPSLAESPSHGNNYNFWGQFLSSGAIAPGLPSDSPWEAVGPPTTLSNLVVTDPQIATFQSWTIPTLGPGDPGHYCIVAFVHSAENPINETSFGVDAIATDNPQVAQRNLHVTTMAPMDQVHRLGFGFHDYIEFHNPSAEVLVTDFVFDFRELPRSLRGAVQLTHLPSRRRGLRRSIVGGTPAQDLTEPHVGVRWLRDWSDRLRRESKRTRRVPEARRLIGRYTSPIYAVDPSCTFEVNGVQLGPFENAAGLFAITTAERSALLRDFRFQVLQRVEGRVVGGSTYVIRAAPQAVKPAGPPPFAEPPFDHVPGHGVA